MDTIVAVIVACVGCTAFWQLIDHTLESRRKDKFDIESAVKDIQKDMTEIRKDQTAMQKSIDCLGDIVAANEVANKKARVLQSYDETMRGIARSKDRSDQDMSDIDGIERYYESHPNERSGEMSTVMKVLRKQYEYDCEHGTFLTYKQR